MAESLGETIVQPRKKHFVMFTSISAANLKALMWETVVRFQFIKSDGSRRVAFGTLCDRIIKDSGAEPDSSRTHAPKTGLITYFDIEKGAWRCFSESRLVGVDEDYGV